MAFPKSDTRVMQKVDSEEKPSTHQQGYSDIQMKSLKKQRAVMKGHYQEKHDQWINEEEQKKRLKHLSINPKTPIHMLVHESYVHYIHIRQNKTPLTPEELNRIRHAYRVIHQDINVLPDKDAQSISQQLAALGLFQSDEDSFPEQVRLNILQIPTTP